MDLTGKVAIVTGASAGIGAATVIALHGIGMKVVGFARRQERIEQLIDNHDGRLFALKVDLTNQQEIIDGFAWVAENVGPIHALINNAGIGTFVNIIDGDEKIWKEVMDTNFTSVLLCCREAIKNMRENGVDGYIINMSSIAGIRPIPFPESSVYSSSKFALCGMTENLRLELVRMGSRIRTTCMNPGVVKTDFIKTSGRSTEEYDEFFGVTPHLFSEDIADTIKFLVQSPPHVQVVGFARRKEKIEQLIDNHEGRLFAVKVDVTKQQEILDGFAWVAKNVGPIHVLINNAGTGTLVNVVDGDESIWKNIMDTNFTSVLLCCRQAIKNMRENGVDGYTINVSSLSGLRPLPFPSLSVYSASKFAICGLTENLRLELVRMGSRIRTTCMNPGVVKTDIFELAGFPKETCEALFTVGPYLLTEDIANTIKFLVQSPPHVQISNLTIQPVGESM